MRSKPLQVEEQEDEHLYHTTGRDAFGRLGPHRHLGRSLGLRSGYSDTWQLVINTATTIITFLMVFLIQNTQDAKAIQLKLDPVRAPSAPRMSGRGASSSDRVERERRRPFRAGH